MGWECGRSQRGHELIVVEVVSHQENGGDEVNRKEKRDVLYFMGHGIESLYVRKKLYTLMIKVLDSSMTGMTKNAVCKLGNVFIK